MAADMTGIELSSSWELHADLQAEKDTVGLAWATEPQSPLAVTHFLQHGRSDPPILSKSATPWWLSVQIGGPVGRAYADPTLTFFIPCHCCCSPRNAAPTYLLFLRVVNQLLHPIDAGSVKLSCAWQWLPVWSQSCFLAQACRPCKP